MKRYLGQARRIDRLPTCRNGKKALKAQGLYAASVPTTYFRGKSEFRKDRMRGECIGARALMPCVAFHDRRLCSGYALRLIRTAFYLFFSPLFSLPRFGG